jgi:exonuclease VII large subunit
VNRPLTSAPTAGTAAEMQAQALVQTIELQAAEQCRQLLGSALAQAAGIRQRAQAKARARLHRALQQMRAGESQAAQQLQAEIETARRRQASVRARQSLDRAWPALEGAVAQRWQQADARLRWVDALLGVGRARLPPSGWTVRHPASLNADETVALQGTLMRHGVADAQLRADATLAAGLVIEVGGARLDGTPRALLADRPLVESALLAAFDTAGRPEVPP